jgi:CII-binding regulator of phage lambda lysogenization HflD
MNQELINLMKTILQMDSAIQKDEKQMESLKEKMDTLEKELEDLYQQHNDNIKKLSITLNQ